MSRPLDTASPTGKAWGDYSSTSTLPNASGSTVTVNQGELALGDTASVAGVLYVVTAISSAGVATWTAAPAQGGAVTATTVTATGAITSSGGDIDAVGGHRVMIGPFKVTLAAGQSATAVPHVPAIAVAFTTLRAGSITAIRGNVDGAITGSSQQVNAFVLIDGTRVAASQMDFTEAGGETTALVSPGKDASTYTFTAGQTITVDYDSDTITNTPELEVWVEIEQ